MNFWYLYNYINWKLHRPILLMSQKATYTALARNDQTGMEKEGVIIIYVVQLLINQLRAQRIRLLQESLTFEFWREIVV